MKSFFMLIAATVLLAGCATVDQQISLNYNQLEKPFGRHNGTVVVAIAPSKSGSKNEKGDTIVGALNNANGVHKANILAANTLEEWIGEAILKELRVLGFSAEIRLQIPADAPNGILLSNLLLSFNVNKGIVTDDAKQSLKFNVDLLAKGAKIKTFTVSSSDNRTIPLYASRRELEQIMGSSLQEAILQIIPEIIALTSPR